MKKTRRSLFTSLVTLLLCSAMFIGSTFAWFTDTVSNTGNKIQAGTLDVELYTTEATLYNANISTEGLKTITEGTGEAAVTYYDVSTLGENKPLFNYNLWEPGYSTPTGFVIKNNGNLALKYELSFVLKDSKTGLENKNSEAYDLAHLTKCNANSKLEDVIEVYQGETKLGTLKDFFDREVKFAGQLKVGEKFEIPNLKLSMPTTAGNEYENAAIEFDIELRATQLTYEKDGFGSDQYDIDTPWMGDTTVVTPTEGGVYEVKNASELAWIAQQINAGTLSGKTVKLVKDIDLNGIEWIQINGAGKSITFDGGYEVEENDQTVQKQHAIVNLKVSKGHDAGFFSTGSGCIVKNVLFDNAQVKGVGRIAVVVGHGMCTTVQNCTVKNSSVTAVVTNNDDGDKAGAIVGYLSAESNGEVSNCKVENVTVQGYRDIGGIVGIAQGTYTVTGNSIENSTVINDRTNNYKNYTTDAQFDVGEVVGEKTTDGTYSNNNATNVTIEVLSNESIVEKMLEEAQPGDTVVLPRIEGKYSAIELPEVLNDVTIKGQDGVEVEKLVLPKNASIEDLTVDSVAFKTTNTDCIMTEVGDNDVLDIVYKNCIFTGTSPNTNDNKYSQMSFRCNPSSASYTLRYEDCEFINVGRPIYPNAGHCNSLEIINCRFSGGGAWTITGNNNSQGFDSVVINNCIFNNVCGVARLDTKVKDLTITNNIFIGNCNEDRSPSKTAFKITPTGTKTISGNKVGDSLETAVITDISSGYGIN